MDEWSNVYIHFLDFEAQLWVFVWTARTNRNTGRFQSQTTSCIEAKPIFAPKRSSYYIFFEIYIGVHAE